MMTRFYPYILSFMLVLAAVDTAVATGDSATVNGFAEWGYVDYQSQAGDSANISATSLTQQYSLLAKKNGVLNGGRGGAYSLALGYEWTGLKATIDQDETSIHRDKLLYNGNLVVAPGGLPFRLHLFAGDMKTTTYHRWNTIAENQVLVPQVVNDLEDGTMTVLGGTLYVGIKNGSYLGAYRDVLSQFPRFLVDYLETNEKDLARIDPIHRRDRHLAFVSLNKKENWVHYRLYDYTDFINSTNNRSTRSVIIGTIDPYMNRTWVNMTNWIKLSVDGNYTEQEQPLNDPTNSYTLNALATFTRPNDQLVVFPSYSRENTDGVPVFHKEYVLPIYLTSKQRNSSLRAQLISRRSKLFVDENIFTESVAFTEDNDRNNYASLLREVKKDNNFRLISGVEVEQGSRINDGSAKGLAVSLEYLDDTKSSFAAGGDRDLAIRYDGKIFSKEADGALTEGEGAQNYQDHKLSLRSSMRTSPRTIVGGEEVLQLASGNPEAASPLDYLYKNFDTSSPDEKVNRVVSLTKVYHQYNWQRLRNRFELFYKFSSDGSVSSLGGQHALNVDDKTSSYGLISTYQSSEEDNGDLESKDLVSLSSRAFWAWSPSRSWRHKATANYRTEKSKDSLATDTDRSVTEDNLLEILQEMTYTIFTVNGIVRPYFRFYEEYSYVEDQEFGKDEVNTYLKLDTEFYPTQRFSIGAGSEYSINENLQGDKVNIFSYNGRISANFAKLIFRLSYAYGRYTQDDDTLEDPRIEQRWEFSLKKIF